MTASTAVPSVAQSVGPKPAVPIDPIAAIVSAFASHAVVAISDPHGNDQLAAFRLAVIRDPRIIGIVNDIVVENANARFQDLMDRFVQGGDVPYQSLRKVWDETTQPQSGTMGSDIPEFYRAIRIVNAALPRERRLRVLLGDPPIDWDTVHSEEDHRKWIELRDTHPADLIQREVLAKKRRALVFYGQMHAQRKNLFANYESEGLAETLISRLESRAGIHAFTIWWATDLATRQPGAGSWPIPSLALLRGTVLGAAPFESYYDASTRFSLQGGTFAPVPREAWRTLRMEDQFDAILYVGPESAMTNAQLSPLICSDPAYIRTRLERMALAGIPPPEIDRLRQLCSIAAK